MALHDGFFDAALTEGTGEHDRTYGASDFTDYFAKIIGSGVCVHNNPDSFLVRLSGSTVAVSPGYLFINGYWLKNDADYPITLSGQGAFAIVAHLNKGQRMIELLAQSAAQASSDSLTLAVVDIAAGTVEDKRYDTDLCGVIDTAGELGGKVEWAINYIDSEIESKLADIGKEIAAQSAKLDKEIAEARSIVEAVEPVPVGTIKFSAETNVAANWLKCDGSTVSKADYPALVAALSGGSGSTATLPNLIMDGVPGYIKAFTDDDMVDISVKTTMYTDFVSDAELLFCGDTILTEGTFSKSVPKDGVFTVGVRKTGNKGESYHNYSVLMAQTAGSLTFVAKIAGNSKIGTTDTAKFKTSDYIGGIKIQCQYG